MLACADKSDDGACSRPVSGCDGNDLTVDQLLSLGSELTNQNEFVRAAEVFFRALSRSDVPVDYIRSFAAALVSSAQSSSMFIHCNENCATRNVRKLFMCTICRSTWVDPITLSCGHTFCRRCVSVSVDAFECFRCHVPVTCDQLSSLRTSFLLVQTHEKWDPVEYHVCEIRAGADKLLSEGKKDEIIDLYSDMITKDVNNVKLRCLRSSALSSAGKFADALQDADFVIEHEPGFLQGYNARACSLIGLGRYAEAVGMYLQCLVLDPDWSRACDDLVQAIRTILSPRCTGTSTETAVKDQSDAFSPCGVLDEKFVTLLSRLSPYSKKEFIESQIDPQLQVAESAPIAASEDKSDDNACEISERSLHGKVVNTESTVVISDVESKVDVDKKQESAGLQEDGVVENGRKNEVASHSMTAEDFECSLCSRLLFRPVMTPCGHVFCRDCLYRSLDYRSDCPLCKESLVQFLAERHSATAESVEQIIDACFPDDLAERQRLHDEEMANIARESSAEIPIFVCVVALPTIPCPLHIFEPRYRHMIRQCMETGTRQFGMCTPIGRREENFAPYGTILQIQDVQYFPDGRSLVSTVGGRRFRVLSRGKRDGCHTANIEYIRDEQVPSSQIADISRLMSEVYSDALSWFSRLPLGIQSRVVSQYGDFPSPPSSALLQSSSTSMSIDGPSFIWYTLSTLPLPPATLVEFISMTSVRDRLEALRRSISEAGRTVLVL